MEKNKLTKLLVKQMNEALPMHAFWALYIGFMLVSTLNMFIFPLVLLVCHYFFSLMFQNT